MKEMFQNKSETRFRVQFSHSWTNIQSDKVHSHYFKKLLFCPLYEMCQLVRFSIDAKWANGEQPQPLGRMSSLPIVKTTTQPQHNPKTIPKQPNTIQRKLGLTRLLVCPTPPETLTPALEQYRPTLRYLRATQGKVRQHRATYRATQGNIGQHRATYLVQFNSTKQKQNKNKINWF